MNILRRSTHAGNATEGSRRRYRLFVAAMLLTFVVLGIDAYLSYPARISTQVIAVIVACGFALTIAVAEPGPRRAIVAAAVLDVATIIIASSLPNGIAAAGFFPYLGAVLLVPSFRGRRLVFALATAWLSGAVAFAIAVTIGPVSQVSVQVNPPISIGFAALLSVLAYGALWWVAEGLRRSADAAAESSRQERRLAGAIEQADDLIIVEGASGEIEYVNPAFEELTGFSADEAIGRTVDSLVRTGDHPVEFYRGMDEAVRRGETWAGRINGRRRDGTTFVQALKVSPLFDPAGQRIGAVRVSRDLTQELELEERLRQTSKMEAVGQLAGGVAHDFNNLLTAIIGFSELIQAQLEPDGAVRADVDQVLLAAGRARDLTRQLLTFARKSVPEPKVLDPGQLIAGFAPMLRRLLGAQIELVVSDRSGAAIRVDPTQLEQTVLNLAVNARDAMPGGGTLRIETSAVHVDAPAVAAGPDVEAGSFVCVAVSDTGIGMDDATRQRIFEPFFTTKPLGEGTGMGLATVFGIVTMAGGWIDVDSKPGDGTTFRVYFPEVADPVESSSMDAVVQDPTGAETILLVEDDPAVRRYTERTLANLGYRVVEAPNGQVALELVASGVVPDLMLTDVVMAGIQGPELARDVRTVHPGLPTLFVSGFNDRARGPSPATDPRSAYLAKPYRHDELSRAVRALLDENAEATSPAAPPLRVH